MKKTYIEAEYRIDDVIFNTGYICIDKDSIIGIFTIDCVIIDIDNSTMNFSLYEQGFFNTCTNVEVFTCTLDIEYLQCPYTYTLISDTNSILTFRLLKKITNPTTLSILNKQFNIASNN